MTLQEAIKILRVHQVWRKGADVVMVEPKELTEAIEVILGDYERGGKYTKEDVLKAGEIGEINHHDYKHIVKLLDEAREINTAINSEKPNVLYDTLKKIADFWHGSEISKPIFKQYLSENNLDEIVTSSPINKSEQKGILIELMEEDAKDGLYESKESNEVEKSEKPINLTSSQTEISDEEIEKKADKETSIEWLIKELKLEGYDHTIKVAKKMYDKEIDECSKKNSIQKINPSDFIDEMFKNAGRRD